MTKTVHYIDAPHDWIGIDDYSSHRPMLWLALNNTDGDVIEFGCGEGSTNLIWDFCFNHKKQPYRTFASFETNKDWASKIKSNYLDKPYLSLYIPEKPISIVFIDSSPGEERKYLIGKYSWLSDVLIVHDTEIGAEYVYGMNEILDSFKYRLNYAPEGKPHTTVVSNFINVCEWV